MSRIILQAYDPSWPAAFETLRNELLTLFAATPIEVEHIGSTAVPGLSAKPVLDILLGAATLDQIEPHIVALGRVGFEYRRSYEVQIPERRYFVRAATGTGDLRVHLHAVVRGQTIWRNHLIFRDALRADPALRDAFQTLKTDLARHHRSDKAAYTAAKAPFVERVLAGHCTKSQMTCC